MTNPTLVVWPSVPWLSPALTPRVEAVSATLSPALACDFPSTESMTCAGCERQV